MNRLILIGEFALSILFLCFLCGCGVGHQLLSAASDGDLFEAKRIIEKEGVDPDVKWLGQTPLMCAIARDRSEMVKYLIDKGAKANFKTANGDPSLIFLFKGNGRTTALINSWEQGGFEPEAVKAFKSPERHKEHFKVIKYLVESGADITYKDSLGQTILMSAARNENSSEIAKYLISKGVNINEKTTNGTNALLIALFNGNRIFANSLIDAGATYSKDSATVLFPRPVFCTKLDGEALDSISIIVISTGSHKICVCYDDILKKQKGEEIEIITTVEPGGIYLVGYEIDPAGFWSLKKHKWHAKIEKFR